MTETDVKFADYKHDMDEIATIAENAAAILRAKIADLQYQLWLVVEASGGKLAVPCGLASRTHPSEAVLTIENNDAEFTIEFRSSRARAVMKEGKDG